jgi:hypothetical protein
MITVHLILLAVLILGVVVCVDRLCVTTPPGGRPARVLESIWVPLLATVPAWGAMVRGMPDLNAYTLASISTPVIAACVVVPLLVLGWWSRAGRRWEPDDAVPLAWPAVAVLLLVMAVADEVPAGVGLIVFAMATVLAWCQSIPRAGEGYDAAGTTLLLCGGIVTVLAMLVAVDLGMAATFIVLVGMVIMLQRVAVHRGPRSAMMAAGWTAALGASLNFGVLGQAELASTLVPALDPPAIGPTPPLAIVGVLLMLLCGCVATCNRWDVLWQRVWAVGTIASAAILIGWFMAV